jgi:hypothetical protein
VTDRRACFAPKKPGHEVAFSPLILDSHIL